MYQIGDHAVIVDNNAGHGWSKGEEVKIIEDYGPSSRRPDLGRVYRAASVQDGSRWSLYSGDMKPVKDLDTVGPDD